MPINTGKTALVTGASSGIGYELAKCFVADGHNVVLVARSTSELEEIARLFGECYGVAATPIAKDLFDPKAPRELYDEVKARGITVDFLVNDAGQGVYGRFHETDLEQELKIIQLNVCALVALTKLFLRDMVARGEGRILQLASLESKAPAPYEAVYSGTKAFIYNFTEAVNEELEGGKVTLTAMRPGATATDFFRKAHAERMKLVQEGRLARADRVAREGYKAMMAGKDHVVTGLANRLADAIGNLIPDRVVTRRMRRAHQPLVAGARPQ